MAKTLKKPEKEQIDDLIAALEHPRKEIVQLLREAILAADPDISEQIKWNSPSFFYNGTMKPFDPKEYKRDIVVLNLHRNDHVLLVFPTGAVINDDSGLLEGKYPDGRKIAKISSLEAAVSQSENLQTVIRKWLALVEK